MIERLRPFQREFLANAFRPEISTAAMSLPRASGKSAIASFILSKCLHPSGEWYQRGMEYLLVASGLDQSAYVYNPLRRHLEDNYPGEYRFLQSMQRVGLVRKSCNTRLRVLSSSGKTAMGIVGVPVLVFDEPGAHTSVKDPNCCGMQSELPRGNRDRS